MYMSFVHFFYFIIFHSFMRYFYLLEQLVSYSIDALLCNSSFLHFGLLNLFYFKNLPEVLFLFCVSQLDFFTDDPNLS